MRIRSIKPEFWRSQDVTDLTHDQRLLFIGLWSYVDDNGVGYDRITSIVADLFAGDLVLEPNETLRRVNEGLEVLAERSLITRYSVDSKDYLYVTNWESHQRVPNPNKPRFPRPDDESATVKPALRSTSLEPNETLRTGTGEQGNRGTDISAPTARVSMTQLFDQFWEAWPLKKGKKEARTAFEKAIKAGATLEQILRGVENYKREIGPSPDWSKVKWPQGWLNGERWDDEPAPAQRQTFNPPRPEAPAGRRYAVDVASGVPLS